MAGIGTTFLGTPGTKKKKVLTWPYVQLQRRLESLSQPALKQGHLRHSNVGNLEHNVSHQTLQA
jgi:hypothetical protein